jgi:hypothetical protein
MALAGQFRVPKELEHHRTLPNLRYSQRPKEFEQVVV